MNPSDPHRVDDDLASSSDEMDVEDVMLDTLLMEVLSNPDERRTPPDQTRIILQKWHEAPALTPPVRATSKPAASTNSTPNPTTKWLSVAAVAAGIILVGGIAWGIQNRIQIDQLANQRTTPNPEPEPAQVQAQVQATTDNARPIIETGDPDLQTPAQRVIELAGPLRRPSLDPSDTVTDGSDVSAGAMSGSAHTEGTRSAAQRLATKPKSLQPESLQPESLQPESLQPESLQPESTHSRASAPPIQLVSRSIDQHLSRYWKRMDVQPTAMLTNEQTAAKLKLRFGIQVRPEDIGNPDKMLKELQRPANLTRLATRFFETLTDPDARSTVSPKSTDPLALQEETDWVAQLNQTWKQRSGMDHLVVSWLESPQLARKIMGTSEPHELLTSVAALTHNVDLRCQRCHDIPALGRSAGRQEEYWRFAATLLPELDPKARSDQSFFYDTLDGRRKLAKPQADLRSTRNNLIGSRSLAGGLVDWVWRMVHGRPLTASVYDITGTADEEMQKLHRDLADDLVASDFDLLRTISLVMTDTILGRSVPDAMTPQGILAASDEAWLNAVAAMDSFAAGTPEVSPTLTHQRLRLVAEVALPKVNQLGGVNAILAQPLGKDSSDFSGRNGTQPGQTPPTPTVSAAALAGLPLRSTWVMPAWLDHLDDFESRSEHIAHLAGKLELPQAVARLANQMRDGGVDEALILQRIWWIIRPQS